MMQPASGDEERWVRGIRAGDERTFGDIAETLGPSLCAFATRYTRSDAIAEELVQDVFVALWVNRARLDLRISIRAYLFGAVRNRALNAARDDATARAAIARIDPDTGSREWGEPDADLERSALMSAIRSAVSRLPPRAREAFELVRQHRLSYAEAAKIMGVSVKTIDVHLGRAVRALRESLRGVWP